MKRPRTYATAVEVMWYRDSGPDVVLTCLVEIDRDSDSVTIVSAHNDDPGHTSRPDVLAEMKADDVNRPALEQHALVEARHQMRSEFDAGAR